MLFRTRYGPWAIVAGAADGLGAATAEALAQRGLHLLMVDIQADVLERTARRLAEAYSVRTDALVLDLGDPASVEAIARRVHDQAGGRTVGLIVYVAAVSAIGPFLERPAADHAAALSVNCATPTALLHRLLPAMVNRGHGGVILYSSMAGFQGSAIISTYAATKAFDLVLAEGLAAELGPQGIDVVACCPGATRTATYVRSRPTTEPSTPMEPSTVAHAAVAALGRRTVVVPGATNRLGRWLFALLGRHRAVTMISRSVRRMYPANPQD